MRLAGRQRGVTLIELVVSIVVISLAVASVAGVLSYNAAHSADPMIVSQAAAIAEAYLEEITLKPFDDPDGADGEPARADFDDVDDYDGLFDAGAADQFGAPIAALSGYDVAVAVTPSSALPGVPATAALRIDVRVTRAPWVDFVLTGWRTRL
ncbi:MAG TPA: prepilin-type N-terminal cleavage/methylation domain-containing protein [Woeseiaceae bacterium]